VLIRQQSVPVQVAEFVQDVGPPPVIEAVGDCLVPLDEMAVEAQESLVLAGGLIDDDRCAPSLSRAQSASSISPFTPMRYFQSLSGMLLIISRYSIWHCHVAEKMQTPNARINRARAKASNLIARKNDESHAVPRSG
jgi:hypothetical protein